MKILRYLVLGTMLLAAIAACSPGGGDDDDDPTAIIVTPTPSDDATATSAGGDDDESGDASEPTATGTAAEQSTSEPVEGTSSPTEETDRFTPTPVVEFEDTGFAYGWNVGLRGDDQFQEHNQRTGEMVNESGMGWVRFQLEWFRFEPQPGEYAPETADRMINSMHEAGLNILVVVAKQPDWAVSPEPETFLRDPEDLRRLMEFVSERYAGKVQAWEIWNEANLAHEVGGYVNVDDYIAMLEAASTGVRAGDPNALVVFGGLTPNGVMDPTIAIDDVNYLNLAYLRSGGEISQYFDVLGVHAVSTHNSPDENWPEPITSGHEGWNDHPSFFFRRVEQMRQVMVEQGDEDKPVWITEFGWSTENQEPGREYAANNTEEEVAQFIVRALEIATDEWSWCTGAFVWNLNWSTLTDPADHKHPSSAVYADWSPRPAFNAIREFMAASD